MFHPNKNPFVQRRCNLVGLNPHISLRRSYGYQSLLSFRIFYHPEECHASRESGHRLHANRNTGTLSCRGTRISGAQSRAWSGCPLSFYSVCTKSPGVSMLQVYPPAPFVPKRWRRPGRMRLRIQAVPNLLPYYDNHLVVLQIIYESL